MTKRLLFLLCILAGWVAAHADSQTDRLMSQVIRDANTYIYADVRAATEDKAYDRALTILSEKVADYFKENGKEIPGAVFLSNISNHSERLISQSGPNRCRVLLYVKKRDLVPLADNGNSAMLAKNGNDSYTLVNSSNGPGNSSPATVGTPGPKTTSSPVEARVKGAKTSKEVQSLLVELKKTNAISGAAAFPIAKADDFYVVVIDRSEKPVALLRRSSGVWTDTATGEKVNPDSYRHCTAYWFTLP